VVQAMTLEASFRQAQAWGFETAQSAIQIRRIDELLEEICQDDTSESLRDYAFWGNVIVRISQAQTRTAEVIYLE
jgi:hypothetical protein